MGWAGGSELFANTWSAVREFVPKEKQSEVIKLWIKAYGRMDCDTLCECFNEFPEVKEVYDKLYPEES